MESVIANPSPISKKKIPAYLIKEEFDGIPLYYKGYKDVLSGKKTLEDIMPSSSIHGVIIAYLTGFLWSKINHQLFVIVAGEVGLLSDNNKRAGLDLAIFDKNVLTTEEVNRHYAKVPPKIVIEVDVDLESDFMLPDEIIQFRTQKLLDAGVEKIIWVFTLSRKIMVAKQDQDWRIFDWNREVEIIDGITFNIATYLDSAGYRKF